ncbi:MAG TPA: hypothetical protein VM942_06445, partial [Acidimicrobiales bacterium]|nr:hypothetical protein [Acidimicrobiales bacterium]
ARPRDERGAMLVLSAIGLVIAMIFTALAIDIGFLAADKRTDQKIADMAALDAARDLTNIQARAEASAARNGFVIDPKRTVFAELVTPNAAGDDYVPAAGGKFVRVTIKSPRKPFFPFVGDTERTVTARAVAGGEPELEFTVGSALASLDTRKSALDNILGPMLGGVNMSAVSYGGLASGSVDLRAIQTELLAMNYNVGSTDELLGAELDAADLLTATARALGKEGEFVAQAEINDIPLNLIPSLQDTVSLGDLFGISQPGADSALDTRINAFDMVKGTAEIANGTNFVSIPGINCGGGLLAGIASCALSLRVIESGQTRRGPVGTVATTSQVALKVNFNLLPLLGNTVTSSVTFTAGDGYGRVSEIICTAPASASIVTHTSAATIGGTISVSAPLVGPLGSANLAGAVNGAPDSTLTFAYPTQFTDPVGGNPEFFHNAGVANLGLAPTTLSVSGGSGLLATVAGLAEPVIEQALVSANTLLEPTLGPILSSLGLDIAGADITAHEIYEPPPSCGSIRLVK